MKTLDQKSAEYSASLSNQSGNYTKGEIETAYVVGASENMTGGSNSQGTFKDRLIVEHEELDEKIVKLDAFILSDKFKEVDDTQRALLQVQATAMNSYRQCLAERIERL